MKFFKRANKVVTKQEPIKIEVGLKVLQTEEGYFGVYQMQTNDELLVANTKERAAEAKRKLDELINWNTHQDIYLSILQGDTDYDIFVEMNRIIDLYGMNDDDEDEQEDENDSFYYEDTVEGISYKVKDEFGKEKEVNGELIVEGLAIHQDGEESWTIDHIPSANMLADFTNEQKAKDCAIAISEMAQWKDKDVINLFVEVNDFRNYLKSVKEAVIKGEKIPNKPQRLLYKMEFFHLRGENSDFKRFCKAIDKLMDLVGIEVIKQEVLDMIYSLAGQERNKGKIKHGKQNLHMVFMGPAGTGKTEVARIMSEILASLGYLEKGNLVEADRSKLVGEHIGHTAPKVKKAVEEAIGGTLFIDEAYSLAGDDQDFGNEAIATLIKEMEDRKGEFVVILAGYQADMNKLLDANEGFRSRIKNYFHFFDYTPEQVSEIVLSMLYNKGYVCPEEVKNEIIRAVKGMSKQGKVEGNARMARNIAENIEEELNIRLGKDKDHKIFDTHIIEIQDVKRATDAKTKDKKRDELEEIKKASMQKLMNLIGLKDLKEQAQRILNTIMIDNMRYQKGLSSAKTRMHMVFYGPPGTGKTTVARIMGEFLKGAGLLSSGHFIEASRSDLVAGYVGQTAAKVKGLVSKAMGGVLFIDEAYSLASGDNFGKEALDTLIKEMEDHGNDLVVILAGYREDMEKLMDLNEGLRSRVPFHFDFPSYTAEELFEMMEVVLKSNYSLQLDVEAKEMMKDFIKDKAENNDGFIEGDGRWVRNIVEELKMNQSNRLAKLSIEEITVDVLQNITKQDIKELK